MMLFFFSRFSKARRRDTFHTINMLKQLRVNIGIHWVQNKIDAFSTGKFGSRNEICITRK